MFIYYFQLGIKSLRRNPMLTALMVMILAIGVAASVSTLTILHVMSGDPIPQKSDRLFTTILNVEPKEGHIAGAKPGDHQLTYIDVTNFLASGQGEKRTGLYSIMTVIEPLRKDIGVVEVEGYGCNSRFFSYV